MMNRYIDGESVGVKANFYRYRLQRIECDFDLLVSQKSKLQAQYRHSSTRDSLECNAYVVIDSDDKYSVDIKGDMSPKLFGSIKVRGHLYHSYYSWLFNSLKHTIALYKK